MKTSNLTLFKDSDGEWNWAGIVSNMWMDREEDILTSDAHMKFVEAIDTGKYKEVFGKDTPDLWVWHVPVPVGYAETVAYDKRGFLIAGGKGLKGEFYDNVFSGLAIAEKKEPGCIGMSHGMPFDYLEIEKEESAMDIPVRNMITGYMSEEFTFLPKFAAANYGTGLGGIMVKSMLEIEDYKEKWFVDTFGENVVAQFNSRLSEIGKAADEADIPKKEIKNMTDSTDEVQETVTEETPTESEVAEESVEELEATEPVEAEEKADQPVEDEEDDEEDDSEDDEEEKQYVTAKDLESIVSEIVKGVAEPVQLIQKEIVKLREDLDKTRFELSELKSSEDSRVADKAMNTPAASLSAIIARTIVGQEGAQLDYNKERTLRQAGPEETETKLDGQTGIPSIDALIKEQRGQRRTIMAPMNGHYKEQ